jgi:hypothetical protein
MPRLYLDLNHFKTVTYCLFCGCFQLVVIATKGQGNVTKGTCVLHGEPLCAKRTEHAAQLGCRMPYGLAKNHNIVSDPIVIFDAL